MIQLVVALLSVTILLVGFFILSLIGIYLDDGAVLAIGVGIVIIIFSSELSGR